MAEIRVKLEPITIEFRSERGFRALAEARAILAQESHGMEWLVWPGVVAGHLDIAARDLVLRGPAPTPIQPAPVVPERDSAMRVGLILLAVALGLGIGLGLVVG